jgi:hypothetical protein
LHQQALATLESVAAPPPAWPGTRWQPD